MYGALWLVLGGILGAVSDAGVVRFALLTGGAAVLFKSAVVFLLRPRRVTNEPE